MISYATFWNTLKESQESTYTLIKNHHISSSTLDKLRKNRPLNTTTINDLCRILNCRVQDVMEYRAGGIRIATPACVLVRNDRFFDKRYGAFRRRGEGTPPYAWVEGAVCGRRRGVGEIGEVPPAADEASRFRGSAPIGGHDSGRESAGTTVGSRRPLRPEWWAVRGGDTDVPVAVPKIFAQPYRGRLKF